jgi:hypothetical protein
MFLSGLVKNSNGPLTFQGYFFITSMALPVQAKVYSSMPLLSIYTGNP